MPQPIEFPQPTVSTAGQLVTVARPLPTRDWANGVAWVQVPESTPLLAPIGCAGTGLQSVSGDTIADGVANWDLTVADAGYEFEQLPFTIYRALRNSTLCNTGMIGDEELERANAAQLNRWVSIAIAQELITGAASGGLSFLNSAIKVSGVEDDLALAAGIDEFTQVAGPIDGLVHYPTYPAISKQIAAAGAIDMGPRFTAVTDAGYQIDFLRNKFSYGATKIAGFVSGDVFLGTSDPIGWVVEEGILGGNVVEAFKSTNAILVFNPLTVVAFIASTVAAYSVTASPQA